MRQPTLLVVLLGLIAMPIAMSATACPSDLALRDAQFEIHPSGRFDQLAEEIIARFIAAGDDFVFDTAGPIRSRYGRGLVETLILLSYDDVTTPQSAHYGDVVFVLTHEPNGQAGTEDLRKATTNKPIAETLNSQLVEVRWWSAGIRQLVYDDDRLRCATPSLPMAENALF